MQALGQPPSDLMTDGAAGSDLFSGLRSSNPQQQLPSDKELDEMFANLPAFTERSDGSNVLEEIGQSLLSKELLGPAIERLCQDYPKWLDENKSKLSKKQLDNYSKQLKIAQKISDAFKQQKGSGSKEDCQVISELMQEMQSYGDPPVELRPPQP